jgi:conjugative transfer signal peptidase TraF
MRSERCWSSRASVRSVRARILRLALTCLLPILAAAAIATRLLLNLTPSCPLGLYWLSSPSPVNRGQLVYFRVPASVRDLVVDRGYLLPRAGLLKPIVALGGDQVCPEANCVTTPAGNLELLASDSQGRPLPHLPYPCGPVPRNQLFVASPAYGSFDSRYFGPIPKESVLGRAVPLITFSP